MSYLTDSTITVSLDINWDFQEQGAVVKNELTSLGGRQSVKLWNDFKNFQIPLDYVPSSDSQLINEWWQKRTQLDFRIDPRFGAPIYSVQIVNGELPFSSINQPYHDEFTGTLMLSEVLQL